MSEAETRYGLPLEVWEAVKNETRRILVECAQARQSITYSELSRRITAGHVPHYGYRMVGLLDEISSDEVAGDRAPLATLVVRKSDGLPGAGYFRKVLPKEAPVDDLRTHWEEQFRCTCEDWRDFTP